MLKPTEFLCGAAFLIPDVTHVHTHAQAHTYTHTDIVIQLYERFNCAKPFLSSFSSVPGTQLKPHSEEARSLLIP